MIVECVNRSYTPFILVAVGTLTIFAAKQTADIKSQREKQLTQNSPTEVVKAAYPNRIEITVKISAHEDLKITKNMAIKKGQVISDRIAEKTKLQAQQRQLELSLKRLHATTIQPPSKPVPVPKVEPLPQVNYLEQEAAIKRAKIAITLSKEEITKKEQELKELSQIPNLDPITIEHEQAKLKQLKLNHQIAINERELAQGKLQTAKQQRKYQEYQASITAARRVEEENVAKTIYERQLNEYNEKTSEKDERIKQLQKKKKDIKRQIKSTQFTSPYSGTVRNIKFLGQDSDGMIAVKINLTISDSNDKRT